MGGRFRPLRFAGILAAIAAAIIVGVPAATAEEPSKVDDAYLNHLSGSVAAAYYAAHPDEASTRFKPFVKAAQETKDRATPRSSQYCASNANKDVFNCDFLGLPQNEE